MTLDLGHLWTGRYGEAAFDEAGAPTEAARHWAEALGDLHPHAIAAGLDAMRDAGAQWWPSVPAFRELCRPAQDAHALPEHRPWQSLPAPERPSPEAVESRRAAMSAAARSLSAGRRSVLSKHYGQDEYDADLAAAQRDGRPLYEVDMAAKARNGWTEEDEANWRVAWCSLPHLGAPYRPGHEPRRAA